MELKDFVGREMILTGAETGSTEVGDSGSTESANTLTFMLDGMTYEAIEDPSDGYRSMLNEVRHIETTPKNMFPACYVIGRWQEAESPFEIVELIDKETGKPVIEFGTRNVDDYYPSYVGNFMPGNMSVNATVESRTEALKKDYAEWGKF